MEKAINERVNTWLVGDFDEDTKTEIRTMMTTAPNELADAFIKTWSLVPAVYEASWEWAPIV